MEKIINKEILRRKLNKLKNNVEKCIQNEKCLKSKQQDWKIIKLRKKNTQNIKIERGNQNNKNVLKFQWFI